MNELDVMLEEIGFDLDNWDLRRMAADLAEDMGDMRVARGLRWQADNEKRPVYSPTVAAGYATWYDADRQGASGVDPSSDIPRIYFRRLRGYYTDTLLQRTYQSRRQAEEALWDVIAQLHNEQTEEEDSTL